MIEIHKVKATLSISRPDGTWRELGKVTEMMVFSKIEEVVADWKYRRPSKGYRKHIRNAKRLERR